ncbi:hypothetical protein PSEUBRA_000413 [Kalmanozyma brasiliensis GHG001]|uniref:Uncharacterized protein n=1 Tax=Kalmanozyma brasiliensis (strain GHG001) TaxID=1365824 RepID=V5GVT9_KALBG|nr:uncharacterized protein PSEUBRA_000413 [Kalmanozyma brasiliensis GHG001]EST10012.1 hypothetical protein PSEUBRA_000413 [Kalmanozyma brasiliensis GHG001]
MSAQAGASAASAQPHHGRQKKNSIGSWFSKKFGRRPSDAAHASDGTSANGSAGVGGTLPARKGASKVDDRSKSSTLPKLNGGAQRAGVTGQQPQFASAFSSDQANGLASTLAVPGQSVAAQGSLTPPPQLDGIPSQEPLGAIDLPRSPRPDTAAISSQQDPGALSSNTFAHDKALASPPSTVNDPVLPSSAVPNSSADGAAAPTPNAIISNAPTAPTNDFEPDTDDASSLAGRDSIGNRTLDTTKSRASTKPTTLMSLDTREPTILPTTHIAQPRQGSGDDSFGTSQRRTTAPRDGVTTQIASDSGSRSVSGQTGNTSSIAGEHGPAFINVPSHTRPHPNNNPHPSGIPADNASVLTLASSNAGMSLGGASRSHHHAPSLGGARSIGGSLMGDRRNSSDTYASLMALPPLSRRGSDSSSRTRDSIAASATGQNSHQAMYGAGTSAGPGAPSDRLSLHRTPSQKTVATQLSIPLSASASNAALQAYAKSEHTANGSQPHLGGSQQAHGSTEPATPVIGSEAGHSVNAPEKPLEASTSTEVIDSQLTAQPADDALLKAQASNLAATEHDETLNAAAERTEQVGEDAVATKKHGELDVPGGPPVA